MIIAAGNKCMQGGISMSDISEEIDLIVSNGCNQALEECHDYLEKEYKGSISEDELNILAQKIVYKKAVVNTIRTLQYFGLL